MKARKKFETYQGVIHEELIFNLEQGLKPPRFINASNFMFTEPEIEKIIFPNVTNDRIFGFLTQLTIDSFFDHEKVKAVQTEIRTSQNEFIIIYGCGASLLWSQPDLLIYADMARWEIQLRMRNHLTIWG